MAKCLLFLAGDSHLMGDQGFKPELNQGPDCLSQPTAPFSICHGSLSGVHRGVFCVSQGKSAEKTTTTEKTCIVLFDSKCIVVVVVVVVCVCVCVCVCAEMSSQVRRKCWIP